VREGADEAYAREGALLFRCTDYGRAVEFAFEYLANRDPGRDGTVAALEVVKNDRGKRETVWTYTTRRRPTGSIRCAFGAST
jgi:hypothetical protein